MKKLILLLSLMCGIVIFTLPTVAQTSTYSNDQKITVNTSDLTVDQLAKIKAEQELEVLEKKLERYGNWVGVGGEVGDAIKEGLSSVVDVADQFGNTDVGKFTLVMVAWKVMGKDVVRIGLGIIFLMLMTIMLFRFHKRSFRTRKICIENPGFFKYPKKYETVKPDDDYDGYQFVKVALYPILFMIAIWITYGIMFTG